MAEIITMPKLSDTMEEGGIANWLVKEGDKVEEGDPLVEIETDKATQEFESPEEGVILKIVATPGKTYKIGEPIAVVGEDGESFDDSMLATTPASSPAAPVTAPVEKELASVEVKPSVTPAASTGGRLRASPVAKKMAEANNIDLSQLAGSGPNGRVIMRDVEQVLSSGVPAASAAPSMMSSVNVGVTTSESRDIPLTMMRKTIAKRLLAGKNDAPHFYLTRSANMQAMLDWRQRLNQDANDTDKPKISVNDLILLACSRALRKHPEVNASWQDDFIREYSDVHMAVAVALPEGLITPVIRGCDKLGVREIAKASKVLGARAKAGDLKAEDYSGGTFTVSNLGMFGIEEFTAIINPPQAAILAVGATTKVPAVNDAGEVVVESRMKMTMSCDHRVVDGAMGAKFLQTLVAYIEDPMMILT